MTTLRISLWIALIAATIFPPAIAQETQYRRLPVKVSHTEVELVKNRLPLLFAGDRYPNVTMHIPIGYINSFDALKTFVDSDGSFSPGLMSFGVHPALRDPAGFFATELVLFLSMRYK